MQVLTDELWADLKRINKEVNKDITYEVDATLHERVDYWTVVEGKGRGDCDDYALTKIRRLVEETEWDRENLSIAICYVEDARGRPGKGEGHAVTVARTDRGDFVVDNRHVNAQLAEDTRGDGIGRTVCAVENDADTR